MLITLSTNDKSILESYTNIVEGISAAYGRNTEVLLHSLDVTNPSIIMIANGHITGRKIGAPITDLALDKLRSGSDVSEPYFSRNKDGALLRSVTSIIKNSEKNPIGILCINTNIDIPLNAFFEELLPKNTLIVSSENFAKNAQEMLDVSIEHIRKKVVGDLLVPARLRNKEIIIRLNRKGVFSIKGAIQHTAQVLGISENVVYRHLRTTKLRAKT